MGECGAVWAGLTGDLGGFDDLDVEIGGTKASPEANPQQEIRFCSACGRDISEIDHAFPTEAVFEQRGDLGLGIGIIAADKDIVIRSESCGIDHHGIADGIERLDDLGLGKSGLDAFAKRVVARDEERGWHTFGKVQWVRDIHQDLSFEVVSTCGMEDIECGVSESTVKEHLPKGRCLGKAAF